MRKYEIFGMEVEVTKGYILVNDEMVESDIAEPYSIGEKIECLLMHKVRCDACDNCASCPDNYDRIAYTNCYPDDNDECEELWIENEYNTFSLIVDAFIKEA